MDKTLWAERLLWLFGLGALLGALVGDANPAAVVAGVVMVVAALGLGVRRGQSS